MPVREHSRKRRLGAQPISRIFPNMITLAGLCCGLSSIRYAMLERWEVAVAFIVAAALLDGLDGRLARMLGATSLFGAQLDSLSDFVCFAVAPALVMYMWQLHEIRGIGWALVLFFAVCGALRLARFNTSLMEEKKQPWQQKFFVGVPAPAGGTLCLLPLVLGFQSDHTLTLPPAVTATYMLLIAVLMASRIPTFAAKHVRIEPEMILPFMLGAGLLVVLFVIEPWWFMIMASLIYLGAIPLSIRRYRQLKAEHTSPMPDLHE